MSHGLMETDTMFSGGNVLPWHGLGTVIEEERVKSDRALELGGLDWDVSLQPVLDRHGREIPNHFAVERSRDERALGVVGKRYHPLQNRDAFEFGDSLVDSGEAKWVTAGSLFNGSRVWMLMELGLDVTIAGLEDERIKPYVLISNSHDGKSAITAAVTPVRVVCRNTEALALATAQRKFTIRHTRSMDGKLTEARNTLGIAHTYFAELERIGNQLVETRFSDTDWQNFLDALIPEVDPEDSKRGATLSENRRGTLTGLYRGAENLENIRGTAWGALQAVIEFSDHHSVQRTSTNSAEDTRMKRIVDGGGIVQQAYDLLLPA